MGLHYWRTLKRLFSGDKGDSQMRGIGFLKTNYFRLKRELEIISCQFPHRVQCNVCSWAGRRLLSDSWHPMTICPRCQSQVRHRLLFAAFDTVNKLGVKELIDGKRILHFAPEAQISKFLVTRTDQHITADLVREDVDLRLDICDMHSIDDGSFDLVIACDVLEHVPDDSAALCEIHRILADQGMLILTVPQKDHLEEKFEDPTVVTPEGREQAFGQHDHLRIYGSDFSEFVEAHGFKVRVVDENDFDPKLVQNYVLVPPVLSDHPLATNFRKVFFGRKVSS